MDKYQHTCNCKEFTTKEDIEKCCEFSYASCDNPDQKGCPVGCVHTDLGMCEPEEEKRTGPAAKCGTDKFPVSGCYQWDKDDETCVLMGKQFDDSKCQWSNCFKCFDYMNTDENSNDTAENSNDTEQKSNLKMGSGASSKKFYFVMIGAVLPITLLVYLKRKKYF